MSGNLRIVNEKRNKYKSIYHINLRKSEKNIKDLIKLYFSS